MSIPTVRVAVFGDTTDYSSWTSWTPTSSGLNIANINPDGTYYLVTAGDVQFDIALLFTASATASTFELETLPFNANAGQTYNGTASFYLLETMEQLVDASLDIDPAVKDDTIVVTPDSDIVNGQIYAMLGSITYTIA